MPYTTFNSHPCSKGKNGTKRDSAICTALVLNPAGWRGAGSLATQVVCRLSFKIAYAGIELISSIQGITTGKRRPQA